MRKLLIALLLVALLMGGWYIAWRVMLKDEVAQVKASITYHDERLRKAGMPAAFKADGVKPSGFPLKLRVRVLRPTLSAVWDKNTYAVSLPYIDLERVDERERRYRVTAPPNLDVVFATEGKTPEQYAIALNEVPAVLLRAHRDSNQCPNMPGRHYCPPIAPQDPLISYAAQLPAALVLDVTHEGKTKPITFSPISLPVPVFFEIPQNAVSPMLMFVNMLRFAFPANMPAPPAGSSAPPAAP